MYRPGSLKKVMMHVENNMFLAERLFSELNAKTSDEKGVYRESYGIGEGIAHQLLRDAAFEIGLDVSIDVAGNTYVRIAGSDKSAPPLMTGSHLDSQPYAGNFDGAAGVVAGLIALSSINEAGLIPSQDLVLVAFRAEETSGWYKGSHGGHIGSRAALGRLWPRELETALHINDGRNLAQHMLDLGLNPTNIAESPPHSETGGIKGFIELHIEQGPILTSEGIPVGIVEGIRGNIRARNARCVGEYTHSGGVPHEYRRDAVIATAEFVHEMDKKRRDVTNKGGDMVYSTGKFCTNPELHALTKVAGEVFFSIDVRSLEQTILDSMGEYMRQLERTIGARNRVDFHLGEFSRTKPAFMDPKLRETLHRGCVELEIPCMDIISGGGHDAVEFSLTGIPSAMIFLRNENGSHNPDESIDLNDFKLGTSLLTRTLLTV